MKFTALLPIFIASALATYSCPSTLKQMCCTQPELQEAGKVAYYCGGPSSEFPCSGGLNPFCCETSSGPYPRGYTGENCRKPDVATPPPTQCKVVKRAVEYRA